MATFAIAPVSASTIEEIRSKMLKTPSTLHKVLGDNPTLTIVTDKGEVTLRLRRERDVIGATGNGVVPLHVECGDLRCRANLRISLYSSEVQLITHSQWDEMILAHAQSEGMAVAI